MLLLVALLACSDPPRLEESPTAIMAEVQEAELAKQWEGIPLQRGQWPAWVAGDAARAEGVSETDNGQRKAHRIAAPRPTAESQGLGEGDASWTVGDHLFEVKVVPAEGPVRTWRLSLDPDPERVAGVPLPLSPSGAEVVAVASPAQVEGVIDLGHQAFGFSCLGVDADLSPDGWCLAFFAQVYAETWAG